VVGLRVFHFEDRSRIARFRNGTSGPRKLTTYVRYPGTGRGPFPLVVFCHGFALMPSAYTRLLDAWTRAGYVVAAPVFPVENAEAPGGPDEADLVNQPEDVSFVISQLLRLDRSSQSRLHGLIEPDRIAVAGHSDGGETAFGVAYERHYLDWRVRLALVLSGAPLPPEPVISRRVSPPLLAIQGNADTINPLGVTRKLFLAAARPKYMLILLRSGHLPPYTEDRRHLAVVERVTIAFLDHYFKHEPLRRLLTAGEAPGLARLTSEP
jgi:dienelactone hydrolase